jgi:ornithine decarboxylase
MAMNAKSSPCETMSPTPHIDQFLKDARPASPCVILDTNVVRLRYEALRRELPEAEIFYAVKANPTPEVVSLLMSLGAHFDVASPGEIDFCLGLHVPPQRLSFGNTIKRESAIATSRAAGVDLFAFDSISEIEKLARSAPGARVFCRILIENKGAEWPLTRKFGCESHMAIDLIVAAKSRGLRPVGLSFHVGSQQTDPLQWGPAIAHAAWVYRGCARHGVALELLNLGGGLPAHYREPIQPLEAYAQAIDAALNREFGSARPHIIIEPGRYLVGDAGLLRTEILLISRKSSHEQERWIYLDAGLYNGLDETLNERIHYRIRTPHEGGPSGPAILAGPTCDSTDILYRRHPYELPLDLTIGDTVDFLSAGAYTTSVASVGFNGFPPLMTYVV